MVPDETTEAELQARHAQGARGVRFNAVSGSGYGMAGYARLAPRLRAAGWHAQFLWPRRRCKACTTRSATVKAPDAVVDHFGGAANGAEYAAIRAAVFRLLDTGRVRLKASGFYRYGYPVAAWPERFGDRAARAGAALPRTHVWASDWPHTWFFEPAHGQPMPYGDLVNLLRDSVGDADFQGILRQNPLALYD